jgi:hypothetical protein
MGAYDHVSEQTNAQTDFGGSRCRISNERRERFSRVAFIATNARLEGTVYLRVVRISRIVVSGAPLPF